MSFGSTAYENYVRIHIESGEPRQPSWSGLSHLKRLAWEAAAQAVAMAVLPASLNPGWIEDLNEDDIDEFQETEKEMNTIDEVHEVASNS
jgi:hypothetical protein